MNLKTNQFLDKLISAILTAVITIFLLLFTLIIFDSNESHNNNDDDSVTIEYDCKEVIEDQASFPEQVISECRNKPVFMKELGKNVL